MLKRAIICVMLALCLAALSGCDALDEALDKLNSKSASPAGSASSGGEMDWSFVPVVREAAVATFMQGFPEARVTETSVATSGGDSSRVIVRISYELNGKTGDYGFDYEKNEAGEYELKRYGDGVSVDDLLRGTRAATGFAHGMGKSGFSGVTGMKIREVNEDKKQYIPLLLLADEQESMIDRYLERGTMYVLEDGNVKAECVVTDEGAGILEIKNIAVEPENQGKGYGKALIDFLACKYKGGYSVLQVGTGDSPLTIPFYEKCGFVRSHRVPNFFTDNYDHPIYEGGVQLVDMVYLQRRL